MILNGDDITEMPLFKKELSSVRLDIQLALNKLPEGKLAEAINRFIPMDINSIKSLESLKEIASNIKKFNSKDSYSGK